MSEAYGAMLAGLTREHKKLASYKAHLQKLPDVVVRATIVHLGIPEFSVEYGAPNEIGVYESGRLNFASGDMSFQLRVKFPIDKVEYFCFTNISVNADDSFYYLIISGQSSRVQFSPVVDKEDLKDFIDKFSVALQKQVGELLAQG